MRTQPFLTDQELINVLSDTKVATAIHIGESAVIQTANETMLNVWGKDAGVIGKSLEDALPELKGQPFIEMFARVWREGTTIAGTDTPAELNINGNLQTFYFDFEYKAVKNELDQTICILHTATDVTERYFSKQREQQLLKELQLLNSNLLESKNQLQFAIDAAELATWDYTPKTGKFTSNNRLKEWFGLLPDDQIGLQEAIKNIIPEEQEKVVHAIQEAMQYSSGGTYDIEYRIINPLNQAYRVVRAKGKAQFDDAKQPVRMSGTLLDITEQKQREQYKDDFISIASHELRTPITSLKASLQLLSKLKENINLPVASRLIEQAGKSMEKTNALVEDLLNASKISAGQLYLSKTIFDIVQMLKACCDHVRLVGKHELVFQGEPVLQVYADEHRVEQVVINIVNNAVKYAPDSKQIFLITEKSENQVKISVKDNGPGIAADKIPHLFSRYYRSDYNGVQFSGIGLGLYISAEIVRKHGGEIGVASELGHGSTFWFTLPTG
ncbi:MAG: PAS domain-containing sensor histidine kinase [Sphingobacteriaceae bacterium]|nr:MAG: PAS domain-containing sensor histidine kinase [Sphingobacteriaceae bacterium]